MVKNPGSAEILNYRERQGTGKVINLDFGELPHERIEGLGEMTVATV